MNALLADDPVAVAVAAAIRAGDVALLNQLLDQHPGLAMARVADVNARFVGKHAETPLHWGRKRAAESSLAAKEIKRGNLLIS